jgi:hypothetical protein
MAAAAKAAGMTDEMVAVVDKPRRAPNAGRGDRFNFVQISAVDNLQKLG